MNMNILRYSLFGIAGSQEVDHTFVKFIVYPLTMIALKHACYRRREKGTNIEAWWLDPK